VLGERKKESVIKYRVKEKSLKSAAVVRAEMHDETRESIVFRYVDSPLSSLSRILINNAMDK
jgi:hypothetical protein